MKKFYLWMLAAGTLILSACALTSCDDQKDIPARNIPTATLTAGQTSVSSITFTVASINADKCAYRVLPAADDAPDAAAVLASGTAVPANESVRVEVDGLNENTSYTVYAAASAGERVGELTTATMTTIKGDTPPDQMTTIELEWADLAYYYTDDEEGTMGNFYFTLIRGEIDDHVGFPMPGPDNFMLGLDLYTAMPADLEHPVCPDGTYTYSVQPGVMNTFLVSEDLTGPSACFIENFQAITFKDGSFTIAYADGIYTLDGTVTGSLKEVVGKYRFLYTGEIPFVNKQLSGKMSSPAPGPRRYGDGDHYRMNTRVREMQ